MAKSQPLTLTAVEEGSVAEGLTPAHATWAKANGFTGQRGRLLPLPGEDGGLAGYLFGVGAAADRPKLVQGLAAAALEPGRYRLAGALGDPTIAALGFRLGAYRFDRYRKRRDPVELELPEGADAAEVERLVDAAFLARDLVNTPASDLGPDALEKEIRGFATAPQAGRQGDRRGRTAEREFPDDPRRRPGCGGGAAPGRFQLGQDERSQE